jgi:tetratricopeptide (TPR) repeat protein
MEIRPAGLSLKQTKIRNLILLFMNPKHKLKTRLILISVGIVLALLIIELSINIYGLLYLNTRHNPLPLKKTNQQITILCLGDSFTYGLNVNRQSSYPFQLEKILNKFNQKNKYIVLNRGIPGTNSSSQAYKLNDYIRDLNPDIIILLTGNTDFGVFDHIDSRFQPRLFRIYHSWFVNNQKKTYCFAAKPLTNPQVAQLIYLGNESRNKQAYAKALDYYAQAIKIDAQNSAAQLELLRALKQTKDFQTAINLALNNLDSPQADLCFYLELSNIFQLIFDGWEFINYTNNWQKNNPRKGLIIPELKQLAPNSKQTLQGLIRKAYGLYTLNSYDAAFREYLEIYQLFNQKLLFEQKIFSQCPNCVKHELLTMIIYGLANALLSENLTDIVKTCQRQNIQLIFLSYPECLPPAISDISRSRQITLLDLRPSFDPYRKTVLRDKYLQPSGHCTALGNQLIARQLAAEIEQEEMNK